MKKLKFDLDICDTYLQNEDYEALSLYIKDTFTLGKNLEGNIVKFEFNKTVICKLYTLLETIKIKQLSGSQTKLLVEIYRALRNYVTNPDVQSYLITIRDFLTLIRNTITLITDSNLDDLLKIILQFLINLVISNELNSKTVYNVYHNEIETLLKNKKQTYEISALLYNISLYAQLRHLDLEAYISLFDLYDRADRNAEYLQFLLEKLILGANYWEIHPQLEVKHRITTLQHLKEHQIKGASFSLPENAVSVLIAHFNGSAKIIFQTIESNECNEEPYEVSLLLEVLSSLSSKDIYLPFFQNNKDLLINTGVLLINIHRLGKTGANCFSAIERLNELREPNEVIRAHPAFGFKVGLVRIIGNMCWNNAPIQDLVREAELIPILLDCCNMDARNPFIMQWVIFAIRNLCNNNVKNQQFIASLHQEGSVSTATLEEMGLTLQSDAENSLKIIPLDSIRPPN